MRTAQSFAIASMVLFVLLALPATKAESAAGPSASQSPGLTLTYAATPQQNQPATAPAKPSPAPREAAGEGAYGYRGVSRFFNIREAYSNTEKGEWEFEVGSVWFTYSRHERDEVAVSQSLKYGITDDLHVEIELEEPLGYSGRGAPEAGLTVFNTFWHEGDILPAFGGYASMRIPSGYESSGVDGQFGGILTKTLFPRFRAHFEGWVMTANGHPGDEDGEDRRAFQWGLGPGFDYQISESTLAVLNYLHRVSEGYGQHNNNILELGMVQRLTESDRTSQYLKLALDVGLDGQRETPNLGAKLLWEIDWK